MYVLDVRKNNLVWGRKPNKDFKRGCIGHAQFKEQQLICRIFKKNPEFWGIKAQPAPVIFKLIYKNFRSKRTNQKTKLYNIHK